MRLALLVLLVMDKFVRGEGRATAAGATRADDRIEILQGIAPNTDKDHLHRVLEHAGGNIVLEGMGSEWDRAADGKRHPSFLRSSMEAMIGYNATLHGLGYRRPSPLSPALLTTISR